ncbi:MAG: DNA-dependent RNA polymerase auxiliary subunit epsilon family protein [Bacillaceae bacterium]|nr:DNA-dependent RNA polymerase auxiliary subunit epsilon family protein [Bacillaceae bacterium]
MIYKVLYQEKKNEVPIRENTKSIYVEGTSVSDVMKKLTSTEYNIEFVLKVDGNYLEYEKLNENFEVETV